MNFGENPIIVITDVPAEVCDLCGESVVGDDVARRLDEIKTLVRRAWTTGSVEFPEDAEVGGSPGSGKGGVVRICYHLCDVSEED
jgi:hypothetical protein